MFYPLFITDNGAVWILQNSQCLDTVQQEGAMKKIPIKL